MTDRDRMDGIVATLRELHAALLDHSRRQHERFHGRVRGAGELLQLVAYNDSFAWLHPLSQLLVDLDEGEASVATARARTEGLLVGDTAFARRHREVMQSEPAVVLAHGAVMRALTPIAA